MVAVEGVFLRESLATLSAVEGSAGHPRIFVHALSLILPSVLKNPLFENPR
jgi:hypothetical protein